MKLLILDDHAVVRSGLRRLLQPIEGIDVIEASTALEALNLFNIENPDVIMIDINLPGMGGLELLRRLVKDHPGLRALVFSMHAEPIYAAQALRAGARGYISKNAAPDDIIEAIRRVADGGNYVEHQLAQELALRQVAGKANLADLLPSMKPNEIEVLRLLSGGKSLTEIAAVLGVSYKTIANRLSMLKSRLGVSSTVDLVRVAIKSGIAF